jgi:catechol 2,3-dioxygenase-like lactoylglutathione lyase family enzyme/DNA-binding transcriptional ArsR family regulator
MAKHSKRPLLNRGEAELANFESVFRALAHRSRRHILVVIHARGGSMSSGEIADRFSCSWPTTTKHLRVLEDAGLVTVEKRGREWIYRLQSRRLERVEPAGSAHSSPPTSPRPPEESSMPSEIVFACYRPKPGKDRQFRAILARHVPTLWELGLVTNRAPIIVRSGNGSYVEVFEWKNAKSVGLAHEHPMVAKIWEAMGKVANWSTLKSLEETGSNFPHFTPVELRATPRVYRVAIPVTDIDKACAFYGALLGMPGHRVCPTRHNFDCGGTVVAVFDPTGDGQTYDPKAQAGMLYFSVPDLKAAFARAKKLKFKRLDRAIGVQPWGERSFYGRDPFGNQVGLVEEATTAV